MVKLRLRRFWLEKRNFRTSFNHGNEYSAKKVPSLASQFFLWWKRVTIEKLAEISPVYRFQILLIAKNVTSSLYWIVVVSSLVAIWLNKISIELYRSCLSLPHCHQSMRCDNSIECFLIRENVLHVLSHIQKWRIERCQISTLPAKKTSYYQTRKYPGHGNLQNLPFTFSIDASVQTPQKVGNQIKIIPASKIFSIHGGRVKNSHRFDFDTWNAYTKLTEQIRWWCDVVYSRASAVPNPDAML